MDAPLKKLPPSQAWEEVERRSLAIGVAGVVVVGALQAAGPLADCMVSLPPEGFGEEPTVAFRRIGLCDDNPAVPSISPL